MLLWAPPMDFAQASASGPPNPRPQSQSGRPEYVRLHGFDGTIYEGRYQGMDSRRDNFLLTDAIGELHLVPRESIERIEAITTAPTAPPLPQPPGSGADSPGAPPSRPAPPPAPPSDEQRLREHRGYAIAFGVTSGVALSGAMGIRLAYARSVQDFECNTISSVSSPSNCSRGARLLEPGVLLISWPMMAAGMTLAGLGGNHGGKASAIFEPVDMPPKRFILAGALTLTAGLGYFALSRPSAIISAWSGDGDRILAREVNFAASSVISYVGAGILGFGVGRRTGLERNLSIAPSLSPEGGTLTLRFEL